MDVRPVTPCIFSHNRFVSILAIIPAGWVKKYGGGPEQRGVGHEVFLALFKGWAVQFSATLRGWVTLCYYIDRH